jgi:hypothetical protein
MATTNNFTFGVDAHPFTLNFPFIDEDNLVVTLDGVVKTLDTDYTVINKTSNTAAGVGFLSGARIQFTADPLPTSGAVKVVRDTNLETTSTFKTGSAIRAVDLNSNFTQTLYVTEEISNNAILTDGSNAFDGDLNMGGNQITNLGTPAADDNAATKLYVDAKVGASGPPGYTNWSYTAVGGETVLGASGPLLEYQVGKEQVYLNGALQQRSVDYTANDGTTITITPALIAGDIVMVRCVNYLAADPTSSYDYSRWTYTAAGGETSLSGGSPALSYTASREQVFLNGALLQRGTDYTATNGTSISIVGSPLISGDMVEVHSNNSI